MKRILPSIIFLLLFCLTAMAQQDLYKWRIGIHGGLGTYYGDLSARRLINPQPDIYKFWENPENLSYGLYVQYAMSKPWAIRFSSTRGTFQGGDRSLKWNGDPYTDNPNYIRSLNFRTTFTDFDAVMIYHFDNERFFPEASFFAPYIGIGLGYANFDVKGDLFQEDGSRYYYWSDLTVRDLPEGSVGASVIELDGIYETSLRDLETEGKYYGRNTLTIPMVMGLKFRLSNRFNVNLETLLHYSLSDRMDDVTGAEYLTSYDNAVQAYAANPSGVSRRSRGDNDKLGDLYGVFNLSIAYNFGFRKESFQAPIFYLGKDELPLPSQAPKIEIEEEMSDSLLLEEYSSYNPKDTFEFYTEPVYIVNRDTVIINEIDTLKNTTIVINDVKINDIQVDSIMELGGNKIIRDTVFVRDTVYQQETIIKEKVIIRDTTFRTGDVTTPTEIEKVVTVDATNITGQGSIDTIITFDPVTKTEEVVIIEKIEGVEPDLIDIEIEESIQANPNMVYVDTIYSIDPVTKEEEIIVTIEDAVPAEPVFTIEKLDAIEASEVDSDLIAGYIGAPRVDLTKEEKVLNNVQESNFELVALRNEINELKAKDDRSQAEIDAIYAKLDEINNDYMSYDDYNNRLAREANDEYNKPENQEVQTSTDLLRQDLADVRSEVIFLETNTDAIPKEEYELIRKENEKRAKDLEKEMRKLRKRTRKAELKAAEAQRELANISKRPEKIIVNKEAKNRPSKIVNKTYLTEGDSMAINNLELEIERIKNASLVSSQRKDVELAELRAKLAALETKMNVSQNTGGNTDATTLNYISKLEAKLNNLDAQLQSTKSELSSTKNELATVKNRPQPVTTTIVQPQVVQPTPTPRPSGGLIVTVNPAQEAIDRLGDVNVYFGTGKSSIGADYFNELNRVVNLMNRYPNVTARLVGYTDKSGNPAANLKLSQKRSESVASYLRSRGVDWSRIKQSSQGEAQATKNDDPLSRRVEVVLSLF